jgi:hypothetical protein
VLIRAVTLGEHADVTWWVCLPKEATEGMAWRDDQRFSPRDGTAASRCQACLCTAQSYPHL